MSTSKRTEYITYYTVLTPDLLGNRRKVIDIWGDVVYINTIATNARVLAPARVLSPVR